MKKTALVLALCLAVAPARSQNQNLVGFLEGLCAGAILGLGTGILIIVAYRCATTPRELTQNPSSRPDWTIPPEFPPVSTNTPPATNVVKMLVKAGEAMPVYDISSLGVQDRNGGCQFTNGFLTSIEYSQDGQAWAPLFRLYGWISGAGRLAVVTDADWHPIATNYAFGTSNFLALPFNPADSGYFRLVAP